MSDWIDVSVALDAELVRWPGDAAFELRREGSLARGDACNLSSFSMSAHLGTHVDSPLHYAADGASMDELDFDAVVGAARVIGMEEAGGIRRGERVLFKTENSNRAWQHEPFDPSYTALTPGLARELAARRPALVGIDYLSIGTPDLDGEETHRILLGAGIWIVESLDLRGVERGEYDLICLPLKIAGAEGAPARVLLRRR